MPPTEPECEKQFQPYFIPINWETITKKEDHFLISKSWGNSTFLLSSYFHWFVYFRGDSPLFNVKLDAEPKVGILQFKAKEQKNSQDVSVTSDPILVKASLGSNMRCSIIIWNQGRKLKDGTVLGKQRIFMCDVSSWNDVFKLSFYAVVFFLASV